MKRKGCDIVTTSPEETKELGHRLAQILQPGDVLALEGDLGAGKTTFSQGLAQGLGIPGSIDSPTFTLIKEYEAGRLPFYHMDVYRLEEPEEELGWDEYFYGQGVTLVEWAGRITPWLPEKVVWITIHLGENGSRKIVVSPPDEWMERFCRKVTMT
ncbi:tRNA (adenosine(37)-N6)-threonylcarbamoyltransferase complex ATPase subunit type 1 TsaE [Kroppenstedtia pulmonis]|uniref:tRNA threonylcarbamoyladenosine biosynthesis protein TsaE n=1 Tax=Kroppenstedtia pulmonis TaxID=1380685 RepID=A0A7D4B3K7_9BACL|nr:tRNA (adenosine(37)-N6)-threonylcarbamoyltransferase complex ATPase subunit type 1 TsaE [Kroppenstedtia pulmonis]QKG85426.1 tRNA (adenosine(37)-N6)-threonylcarbamoyltransferase complex ATPase subunit type 1 TsaE [Kroppenstedtia pulmonis]